MPVITQLTKRDKMRLTQLFNFYDDFIIVKTSRGITVISGKNVAQGATPAGAITNFMEGVK